jgi:hypothetical protein
MRLVALTLIHIAAVEADKAKEPKRREKGAGSRVERPRSPACWYLRAYAGRDPATGRPRQSSSTVTAANPTAARRAVNAFIAEVAAQPGPGPLPRCASWPPPSGSAPT